VGNKSIWWQIKRVEDFNQMFKGEREDLRILLDGEYTIFEPDEEAGRDTVQDGYEFYSHAAYGNRIEGDINSPRYDGRIEHPGMTEEAFKDHYTLAVEKFQEEFPDIDALLYNEDWLQR
jgi:hypothetical protein